jgi:hypothetical protein
LGVNIGLAGLRACEGCRLVLDRWTTRCRSGSRSGCGGSSHGPIPWEPDLAWRRGGIRAHETLTRPTVV